MKSNKEKKKQLLGKRDWDYRNGKLNLGYSMKSVDSKLYRSSSDTTEYR